MNVLWELRGRRRSKRPRSTLPDPASAAAPPCPPRRRRHSGRVALRIRRDRRLPPPAKAAGDDSADTAADFLHSEIADPDLDRISPPAAIVRRARSGGRDGAVGEPFRPPGCEGPAAPASPLPFRGAAARHAPRRSWRIRLAAARGRRRPGVPGPMLLRSRGRELAIASRERSREALDEREPDRRLPPRPACAPRGRPPWRAPAPGRTRQFRSAKPSRDHFPSLGDHVGFLPEVPGRRGRVPASPRTGAPPLPRRVRPAGTGSPGAVRSLLRERLGPCGRSAFASVRSAAGLALCAAAVLIPVPNALDLRLRIRPLPARPYVRVRTGEAAVGAAEGRSDLKPDGVSERDRDRLAVRHHVHGDVVPPDPSADSLQEGGPAVAAASEPDSLQVTFSQGLHVASHLSPPR